MKYDKKTYVKSDGRRLMSGGPRDLQRKLQSQEVPVTVPDGVTIEELKNQISGLTAALTRKPVVSAEALDEELRKSVAIAIRETEVKYEKEIIDLKNELAGKVGDAPKGYFSPEQVDEEINKAVNVAIADSEKASAENIKKIESKLVFLINEKSDELDELSSKYEKLVLTSDNEILRFQDKIEVLEDKIKDKERAMFVLEERISSPLDINDERIAELVVQKIAIDSDGGSYDPNQPKMETIFIDPSEAGAEDKLEGTIDSEVVSTTEKENVADKAEKLKNLIGKLPKVL